MSESRRAVAILVYDEAEVLDFAGPFEVFSVTAELNGYEPFDVFLVAEDDRAIRAVNGLRVLPDYTVANCPKPDILVVAGGAGSRRVMANGGLIDWVTRTAEEAEIVMSVCSGARILARAGLLDGLAATTHHEVFEHLRELAPEAEIREGERFVDAGRIITTGGISAGIDGSFHVVERLLGPAVARRTADYMEYDRPGTPA